MIEREREGSFEPDGYVYVLEGGGYWKIGMSRSLNVRLANLARLLPFEVETRHVIPCEHVKSAEAFLHRSFAERRTRGEWFVLDPADEAYIASIGRMRGEAVEFGKVSSPRDFERIVRISIDMPRDLQKYLRDVAYDTETDAMSVMRALLRRMKADADLEDRIWDDLADLQKVDRDAGEG